MSATILRPAVEPPWPAFVFANGATPDGRSHPIVRRLGVALARSASLAVGLARSLAAMLPTSEDARALGRELRALTPDTNDPLAPLRTPSREPLGPGSVAVRTLLANRDPKRFGALYSALPHDVRQTAEALSPLSCGSSVLAPVEIATAPQDKYFPVGESLAVACLPRARLTVTSGLTHVTPRLDPRNLVDLVCLDGFFVRTLLATGVPPQQWAR